MRRQICLSLTAFCGRTRLGDQVGVVERQRIVGERDAGDVGFRQRQLLGRDRGQAGVVGAVRSEPGITRIFGAIGTGRPKT